MHKSGIYSITNIINSRVYVGSAIKLNKRFYEHKSRLRKNNHHNILLQRAWNKYGEENFKFEILELVVDLSLILEKETYWIDKLNCLNKDKGYNICKFGRSGLGTKRSNETKLKMKLSQQNRKPISIDQKLKISKSLKGHKRTLDFIEKQRNRFKNKTLSDITREKLSKASNKRWSKVKNFEPNSQPLTIEG